MDGTHQPTELHAGHDVLDALERPGSTGPIIEEQENAGADLYAKEKERDAAKEIPVRQIVGGDGFLSQGSGEFSPVESFLDPVAQRGKQGHASRFRETPTSSPCKWTSYTSSGRGGGPETLRPFRS